ncbi:hypothetical protein BD414DRAFT_575055 [Trametes punicea]|nr:hypothetical protein BD414DRAFT_575055 [Trametes punicea]
MSSRQRSAATSRKDSYGLWRPNDSDSDRPRQTMPSSQRHNADRTAAAERSGKHRSSRRTDALDPSAVYAHRQKSSSKEQMSAALQSSYYGVPQSAHPSTNYHTQDAHSDAYGLRAYIKKKTEKRSPRSSHEKLSASEQPYASLSSYPRQDYTRTATSAQPPPPPTNYHAMPPEQKSRDPASSRHHREREKDKEISSIRDVDRSSARNRTVETSVEREHRRRREKDAAKEKERSSKDRERHKEKEKSKHREARAAPDHNPPDVASVNQAYPPPTAPAQRSADRLPAVHPDFTRAQPSQTVHPTVPTAPWSGLTAGGRAASIHQPTTTGDAGYPSASDREDPPLPIPPPGHRRERSASKTHRSRHQVLVQQAAQDSGVSSSEQELSGIERTRRYASREQASTLGRGHSSGPSGSENERAPPVQKERRKHRTQGESSRHKSRTAPVESQDAYGPTTSQEIASAWYQQHQRETVAAKPGGEILHRSLIAVPHDFEPTQTAVPPAGKPTPYVGLTTSHRAMPQIVSIRAGQGPSEPHSGTMLPKTNSATSVTRQGDAQSADRAYDGASRAQTAAQYSHQTAGRHPDASPHAALGPSSLTDPSRGYQQASATSGVERGQQPLQGSISTAFYSRHAESSGATASALHGTSPFPDVVVRPPSAAPTHQESPTARDPAGVLASHYTTQSAGRLQVPLVDSRSRATPAPAQSASHSHAAQVASQPAAYSQANLSPQAANADPYRSASANVTGSPNQGSLHAQMASQDLHSKLPVYEDTAVHVSSAQASGRGTHHIGGVYSPATHTTARTVAVASEGQSSPKRNMTYPGASAPARPPSVHVDPSNYDPSTGYDPRSPKPPSIATITADAPGGRTPSRNAHGREPSGQNAHHQPSSRYEYSGGQPPTDAGQTYFSGTTGHSPSRHHLPDPAPSPAVGPAVSIASASGTPKHSPSGRLHSHRNGSNDTITYAAPTKPSPSGTIQQQLPPSSAVKSSSHAMSRPDYASTSRQPNASSVYPEHVRYRSPAPPGYPTAQTPFPTPNGVGTGHSSSYSTQTAYDYQYGRTPASPAQATYTSQYPQTSTQTHPRVAQSTDHGHRPQDPPHSAPPASSTTPTSSQRLPPRTAASPAPVVRPTRLTALSSPPGKAPSPLQGAPPQPTRNQTYPAPAPIAHSRTVSDPQYSGKMGTSPYPSTSHASRLPASSRTAPTAAQQPDVLLTPSSLAPSMLPQVATPAPLDRTTSRTSTKDKDKEKKKGFFGINLFRSRSSPPKPREVEPPPSAAVREKRRRNLSQPSQPLAYMQASNVGAKSPTGAPSPQVAVAAVSIPATPQSQAQHQHQYQSQPQYHPQHQRGTASLQVPIAAPTPVPLSGERSPTGKMFTPFRLLSRKHRTVSAASVEAVEGTVINAMLTGGDSTRSSTAGRPSPPLRDPLMAAQEWRNREEQQQETRGTARRRRPGVTFDVGDEVPEDGRVPLQKSLRANMADIQATVVPVHMPSRQATA